MKKTLIESFIPVEDISEEAKVEKMGNAKPPTSSMHYWWTRKPLIASRAAVLGSLLPQDFDRNEFKYLLGIDEPKDKRKERAHKKDLTPGRIEKLQESYKKVWGKIPKILDPFAGGGSIPFETMRVGVDAISNDYNPVAYLIEKATLEFPRKYGRRLYEDVEKGFDWVLNETKKELNRYYPDRDGKKTAAYIWAWVASCPSCGFENPLVGQWVLTRKNKQLYLDPSINENNKLDFEIKEGDNPPSGTCSRGKGKCLNCGSVIPKSKVKEEILEKEKEKLLAIVLLKPTQGKEYVLPKDEDINAFNKAKDRLDNNWNKFIKNKNIPLKEISGQNDVRSQPYLKYWHRFLNPRQKLLFATLEKNIKKYANKIIDEYDEEYGKAIATYLSFIFPKHFDYNCRSTSWHKSNEQISSSMGRRGISMMWDHTEVNPFVDSSGTLPGMVGNILDGLRYATKKLSIKNVGEVEVKQNSVTKLDDNVKLIVTDPPYLDDVQYAELSEFLYVWEQMALEDFYKLGDVPKDEDMSVGAFRDKEYFNRLFKLSTKKMYEILDDDGLLVMFFAHSDEEAWDFVINALREANFRITATWPIHTENTRNPMARGKNSIMSSIIITARKMKKNKIGFIEDIQEEIKNHLSKRLDEFWSYGLRGADLTVAAMGASLDILTQYSEIKSYTGEMKVKDLLELVQKYVAEFVLDSFLGKSKDLDGATSFYLYSRLSDLDGMSFDTANLISKSLNLSLKSFEEDGFIKFLTKGNKKGIKLLNYTERDHNGLNSLIDSVQYLMHLFEKEGFKHMKKEMENIPYGNSEIRDVFEALLALEPEDQERKVSRRVLERMGHHFPKEGQQELEDF